MTPDPETVRSWHERAQAYDRFSHRWEIFSLLSTRLIDLLPADLHGAVLDIGAGSGLTSELLLARHPRCEAILLEPAVAMLDLARQNLAGRPARFFAMSVDEAPALELRATAAIASASMQFIEFEPAFAALAHIIEPGGQVAFNLWWHHWEETATRGGMSGWFPIAQAACVQAGLPPLPPPTTPKFKTRAQMMSACGRHGFIRLAEYCDEDVIPVSVGVDFRAMDAEWPVKGMEPKERAALLESMHGSARDKFETVVSSRFLFVKASRQSY